MTWEMIFALAGVLLAGDGIIKMILQRRLNKKDKMPELMSKIDALNHKVDKLSKGIVVLVDTDETIIKALQENHLNGEGDKAKERLEEFKHQMFEEGVYD